MKFYKIPFIWLITPFILGITSSKIVQLPLLIGFPLCVFNLLLLLFVFKTNNLITKTFIRSILLFSCFFMLGNCITTIDKMNYNSSQKKQTTNSKYFGTIQEASVTKSGYIKYIVLCKPIKQSKTTLIPSKKLLFIKNNHKNSPLNENNTIVFHCNFQQIRNLGYPGEFDSEYYWKNKEINEIGFINNESNIQLLNQGKQTYLSSTYFRKKLTEILKSVLSGQELALANALILGERNLLTKETTQGFSDTGAMHILAVSGLHIGILLQIMLRIFHFFEKWITKNQAILFSLCIVWVYALITGFSPSVIRSVIMFSFLLIGKMKGKENSELNLLAFSAFIILSWKPIYLYDIGFQLSYTAMLGIYLFYPFLKNVIISPFRIIQLIIEGTMVGIAAQITTIPLTIFYFHQFPNYFILTNIALMAFSFVILLLGILLFSFFWITPIKLILGIILQKTMTCMLVIVNFFSQLPFATAKGFSMNKLTILILYAIIGLLFISLIQKKIKLTYLALFFSFIISTHIFYVRLNNNKMNFKYIHSEYPNFQIIKSNTTNYFVFPSHSWSSNKTKRIMQDFTNLYPGKNILIPMEKLTKN